MKCTKKHDARAELLFCSLNLLFVTVSLPLLSWHLKVPIVVIFVNVFIVIILIIISLSSPLARLQIQPSLFALRFQRRFPRDLQDISILNLQE